MAAVGLNKPFPAYSGTEPYVFVCYAHRDAESVYADLILLDGGGLNLWYDEGISAGSSWRAEIAAAIESSSKFLFFISESSLNSTHCLREVDYALNHDIEIIPVYVEECTLPPELQLVLNRVQALFRKTDSLYMQHLLGALQKGKTFAPLRPLRNKQTWRIRVALLAVGLSLMAGFLWMQNSSTPAGGQVSSSSITKPSAFDRYLEGLELMERWDKDDNLDTAISLFRKATSLDPNFALAFARLADALRYRYALTGDQAWLDEASDNVEEAARLNSDLAPVQVALGRIHAMQGNNDLAFAAMEHALSIDANDAAANQAIASIYARLGRLEDAEASYKKAITLDPDSLSIHDSYANFLFGQSRFEEAAKQWQLVIRSAPDHYVALVNLGSVLSEIDRIPEATSMYLRATEIKPTYMAYSNLGTAYSRAERYSDAVDAYRKAIAIDDTDWLAWGNLAYIYFWMNGLDAQTTETFEHAIQLAEANRQKNARDPWVHSDLALYYAKTEKPDLALLRIETAIALSPDSGEILAAAAEVYETIGQRDKAVELALNSLEVGFSRQRLQRNRGLSKLFEDARLHPAQ